MQYGLQYTAVKDPNTAWHHTAILNGSDHHLKSLLEYYYQLLDPNGPGPVRLHIISETDTELVSINTYDGATEDNAEELLVMWFSVYPDPKLREFISWKRKYLIDAGIQVSHKPAIIK